MANFDKAKPAGSQKLRLADDDLRTNNDALEDAIGRDHKFPTGYGVDAGMHAVIQLISQVGDEAAHATAIKLWNKAGVLRGIVPGGAAKTVGFTDAFIGVLNAPTGTEMVFIQNAAPTGWTRNAARQDNAVLCYASAGNPASGGGVNPQSTHTHTGPNHTHTGPSHTHTVASHTHTGPNHTHTGPSHAHTIAHTHTGPNHTHTGPSHTHTTAGHALTTAELAVHGHTVNFTTGGGPQVTSYAAGTGYTGTFDTNNAGGGAAHSHGATGAEGTSATGAEGTGATSGSSSANSGADGTGATSAGGTGATSGTGLTSNAEGTGATGAEGTGATGANTAPFFIETISCIKD